MNTQEFVDIMKADASGDAPQPSEAGVDLNDVSWSTPSRIDNSANVEQLSGLGVAYPQDKSASLGALASGVMRGAAAAAKPIGAALSSVTKTVGKPTAGQGVATAFRKGGLAGVLTGKANPLTKGNIADVGMTGAMTTYDLKHLK